MAVPLSRLSWYFSLDDIARLESDSIFNSTFWIYIPNSLSFVGTLVGTKIHLADAAVFKRIFRNKTSFKEYVENYEHHYKQSLSNSI